MTDENVITIKDRKLFYDPYNRGYYFESKIECLERATSNRYKKADALNKNILLQRQSFNRHIDQAEHIFTAKCTREIGELRESLRGHVAYRKVLNQAAKDFELSPKNQPQGKYGTYGPDGYQKEVMPQLEAELKQMNPETRRRKEVKRLLRQRKKPEVFDRTLSDDMFLSAKKSNRSISHLPDSGDMTDASGFDGNMLIVDQSTKHDLDEQDNFQRYLDTDERGKHGKLVLPPIQASMSPTKSKSLRSASSEKDSNVTLPSVFVTEFVKPENETDEFVLEDDVVENELDILD
ncbi:uncharacterized protein LOC135491321 [Lineus longissimus]|uniref:uncharacterized protein LOC135491321 n=1 Tax=Lineus longissimus TaxID=88925 RepID=UPI00315D70FE